MCGLIIANDFAPLLPKRRPPPPNPPRFPEPLLHLPLGFQHEDPLNLEIDLLGGFMATTIPSDLVKTACAHCGREIPTSNIDLHYVHCSRNLQKCTICGDMIPIKLADEHYHENHAPIDCSLCGEAVEREAWTLHKGERCLQRIVTCEYCEFPLPAVDLFKHQEICGNRTEHCQTCNRYVRLREQITHETQCHGNLNGTAESSRDARPAEREEDVRRRQPQNSPRRQIFFTVAITGMAVLLGSIFLQQAREPQQ